MVVRAPLLLEQRRKGGNWLLCPDKALRTDISELRCEPRTNLIVLAPASILHRVVKDSPQIDPVEIQRAKKQEVS